MALKPCAECKEMISDTAARCPKCGSDCPCGIAAKAVETAGPMIGVILGFFILFLFLAHGCN